MERTPPPWTFEELAARVREALDGADGYAGVSNGQVTDVPNARTLRFYGTLGLLDRPSEMRGRTAYYGPRHVQQVVAIKRLQARGLSLADVQARLAGIAPRALASLARVPAHVLGGDAPAKSSPSRRDAAFWSRAAPDDDDDDPAATHLCTLPLGAHASLSLTTVRPLTPGDVRALQEAAHALLGALAARGLVPAAADKESP